MEGAVWWIESAVWWMEGAVRWITQLDTHLLLAVVYQYMLGQYEEPDWLSSGSRSILRAMLQVDPRRRITVQQLQAHEWMGGSSPHKDEEGESAPASAQDSSPSRLFSFTTLLLHDSSPSQSPAPAAARCLLPSMGGGGGERGVDVEGLTPLSASPRAMHTSLEGGLHDTHLLNLSSPQARVSACSGDSSSEEGASTVAPSTKNSSSSTATNSSSSTATNSSSTATNSSSSSSGYSSSNATFVSSPRRKRPVDSIDMEDALENKENLFLLPAAPTPAPKTRRKGTPTTPVSLRISPARSVDSGLNDYATPTKHGWGYNRTPERGTPRGRGAAAGGVFGSIEKSLDKMKSLLTPRRRLPSETNGPALVHSKNLHNVSTTGSSSPDAVLNALTRALHNKGIHCTQKGYTLRGKVEDTVGGARLSFELEVCRVARLNLVGIRRKRLKGDAWIYKRVCEERLLQRNTRRETPALLELQGQPLSVSVAESCPSCRRGGPPVGVVALL
ncbi:Kinase associated domain 1 (KA1) [Trinorchestia longiramus]|nr:Kinase associated domain 1 (KA1) [Trinorchestia longiramus]